MANIKLKNVFICESVIVAFNGQISLINLTPEITSTAFPAIHPKLTVLVGISGDNGSYNEKVEIVSVDDDKIIASVNGGAEIKSVGGSNFIANFINTVFPREGKYWIRVIVGSDLLTDKENHMFTLKKI
jgi:hypothetical protein